MFSKWLVPRSALFTCFVCAYKVLERLKIIDITHLTYKILILQSSKGQMHWCIGFYNACSKVKSVTGPRLKVSVRNGTHLMSGFVMWKLLGAWEAGDKQKTNGRKIRRTDRLENITLIQQHDKQTGPKIWWEEEAKWLKNRAQSYTCKG